MGDGAASSAAEDKLKETERLLDQAKSPQAGSDERDAAALASLAESLWAGEMVAFEKARQDVPHLGRREGPVV